MSDTTSVTYKGHYIHYRKGFAPRYPPWGISLGGRLVGEARTKAKAKKEVDRAIAVMK
jgi:hypothetical protein